MLFALALIPVIGLLIFIYVKDKKEKEPIGLLIGLFFAGMATVISGIILELIGELILEAIFPYNPVIKALLLAFIVVAPAEELGKFVVLRLITWKNKHFDYSYDAIVYAVFVSLGFACLENIGYVFQNGLATALMRMFTAVPGHACFAVIMGYFYSKAKYASLTNNKSGYTKNIWLAFLLPAFGHGVYDGILFASEASGEDLVVVFGVLLWIACVAALFVISIIIVIKSAKNDYCIITLPDRVQTIYRPQIAGTWTCSCGVTNGFNFCSACGKPRPMVSSWHCPKCGTLGTFNFCGNCGCPKPASSASAPAPAAAPSAQ